MYLIVNLGLKSIRIIVFSDVGKIIYSDSFPVHTSLQGGKIEQDAAEWKILLHKLLDNLVKKTDLIPKIEFITSTTSSSCVFGCNRQMKPITKVLMVSDKRACEEADFIKTNSIYIEKNIKEPVCCNESSNVPKLLWVKNNATEVFNDIKYWLGANEFLNYEFTGEVVTDSLNASKSFYSEEEGQYHEDILDDITIPSSIFPEVIEMGSALGLSNDLMDLYPFNKKCKYVITTYDAICAVIGSLTGESGDVCDVSGTVTSARALAKKDFYIKNKSSVILRQSVPLIDHTIIGCSNNLGGGIIEWYKQAYYSNATKGYAEIESDAQESPSGANGLLFLPFLLGERAPFVDKDIRGAFFGINRESNRQDFAKAVFESTAYVTNDLLRLIRNEDFKIKALCVSGGLARFDLINQIKADVTNLPVKVIDNFESTSMGALILIRVSLGHYDTVHSAAADLVSIRKTIFPNKNNVEIYSDAFDLYRKMTELTRSIGASHREFSQRIQKYSSTTVKNL